MRVDLSIQTRAASVDIASANAEERTVDLVWSAGATVKRGGLFSDSYFEELDMSPASIRMERLASGAAPVLNSHNRYDLSGVIGVVTAASVEGSKGRATVKLSRRDDVNPIWQDIQDGIIRNVSVGYRVHKAIKVEKADTKIPTVRIVDWEPDEISLVPIGADAGAKIREHEITNFCELEGPQEPAAHADNDPRVYRALIAADMTL